MTATAPSSPLAERPWPGLDVQGSRILVTGFGVSGYAVADQTLQRGAHVVVVDAATDDATQERAAVLRTLGADIRLGVDHTLVLPEGDFDVVVTSPGWRPDQPLLVNAAERGIPIWSEVELARRMQAADGPQWLTLTGTNGKTTAVTMLEHILRAAGLRAVAAGNVGLPLIEAVLDPTGFDVVAIELSSFQLHWTTHLLADASAILNITDDHVDWHGSLEAYAAAKGRIYHGTRTACFYSVHDERTRTLLEAADVQEGCRAIGVAAGIPAVSELGVVDGVLVDRAFTPNRRREALELAQLSDLDHLGPHGAPGHMVINALTAAGLARAIGVAPAHIRDALRTYRPGAHRSEVVATQNGVVFVDDSKATNPAAARAALASAASIVWIAGGQTKGADLTELVADSRDRLRHVVLIGTEPDPFTRVLAEQASGVAWTWIDPADHTGPAGVMAAAVAAARKRANKGDVVLLAPAAASKDQFKDYSERGDLFQHAVRARSSS